MLKKLRDALTGGTEERSSEELRELRRQARTRLGEARRELEALERPDDALGASDEELEEIIQRRQLLKEKIEARNREQERLRTLIRKAEERERLEAADELVVHGGFEEILGRVEEAGETARKTARKLDEEKGELRDAVRTVRKARRAGDPPGVDQELQDRIARALGAEVDLPTPEAGDEPVLVQTGEDAYIRNAELIDEAWLKRHRSVPAGSTAARQIGDARQRIRSAKAL